MQRTFEISFESLAIPSSDGEGPFSLERLDDDEHSHIHGGLCIRVNGRILPHLGYSGPTDVCFNTWTEELEAVYRAFQSSNNGEHTFDEGEQGQPAFVFKRNGNKGYITIAEGIGGGSADIGWQNVEFLVEEFFDSYQQFRKDFVDSIRRAAPTQAHEWIALHLPASYSIVADQAFA